MERDPMFDALMELEESAKGFKDTVMDTYHKLNYEDQNQAIVDMKGYRRKVYDAFDMLTPDQIREYGKYKAVMSMVSV